MTPLVVRRTIVTLVTIGLALGAYLVAVRIPHTMAIFTIAAFIAFGVKPVTRVFEQWVSRPFAIALVYLGLIALFVVGAVLVIPATSRELLSLAINGPDYVENLRTSWLGIEHFLREHLGQHIALPSFDVIQAQTQTLASASLAYTVNSAGTIFVGTATALLVGLSSLILSVFFLLRGPDLGRSLLSLVPISKRQAMHNLLYETVQVFGHFVAGQVIVCAITGVAIWVLCMAFGFKFALLIGIVSGIAYAVPFVGMVVAQLLAAGLAIPQGLGMVVYVTIAVFVVARISDNIIVPKIMSDTTGVSPIGVMFAVFAGGELFGIPGLLLAIPAAALVRLLFSYFVAPYIVRLQERPKAADVVPHVVVRPVHIEADIVETSTTTTASGV
jgi:predicted PurR-regulated permease PerM